MRRVVDLSGAIPSADGPTVFRLRLDKGYILISHGLEEHPDEVRIPAHEIAVLVLGHRLALTGAVLGAITANGGAVLALDDRFRPAGLMLPIEGNKLHAERLRLQIEMSPRRAPALWQQIVRAKISAQATNVPEAGLERLISKVDLGDSHNIEAQAARIYWRALFGEGFKRHEDDDANKALNYGYAVLRALVARAVCAAGLHPALGLHHRTDTFSLADDMMEPARPLVDRVVTKIRGPLDSVAKRALLGVATTKVDLDGRAHGLLEAYELACSSLVGALDGESLLLPRAA
jgi:CRISPR-associated protein Cas1